MIKLKSCLILLLGLALSTSLPAQKKNQLQTLSIWVNGNCGMCQERIQEAALNTPGVKTAAWVIETRILTVKVQAEKFRESELHHNIAAIGHDTDQEKAPDAVYEKLHACCLYDRSLSPPIMDSPSISGRILEAENQPLIGASVYWLGTNDGVTSDENGRFEIAKSQQSSALVVSYIGFQTDTVTVKPGYDLDIILSGSVTLNEVEVRYRRKTTELSFFAPIQVQLISEKELLKAACCNLSESFETTPSVDVAFTDAVTGTRQIQLLGLSGPNIQLTRENMPDVRGLSALYGMNYTAGPWMEGIQLSMGAGSVVNGFEAIAGQINVELRKPENTDLMYLNVYASEMGRYEGNANFSHVFNKRWSTGLLLHGKSQQRALDHNHDGFLDNPLSDALVAINRWKYQGEDGWQIQLGVKGAILNDKSGVGGFHEDRELHQGHLWGAEVATRRAEGWAKIGKVFQHKPGASIGLQLSAISHEQQAFFGLRRVDGDQQSAYANLIYQDILGNTNHQYKTGLSFQWDKFHEYANSQWFHRNEQIPGAFFEYTYHFLEKLTAVAGIRADHHNNFGFFATPRIHLSYTPNELTVIRLSAGRGQRTASIWAENIGIWASSRNVVLRGVDEGTPYGLQPEVAWNSGINFTRGFEIGDRAATFTTAYYYTHFVNQVVVDFDESPQQLFMYNLEGQSYSHSAMAQLDMELIRGLDARLAYRFNDVRTTYGDRLLEKPLLSRHRAFLNLAYATESDWHVDLTVNWQGSKRIPGTGANPLEFQLPERSPDFYIVNAQISKRWGEKYDLYLGAENLLGFTQAHPILGAADPFGAYFDSSMVWGPIFGRNIYIGGRWRIKHR
jgi:outer membrane receptor for ferrienterochelin and colicins